MKVHDIVLVGALALTGCTRTPVTDAAVENAQLALDTANVALTEAKAAAASASTIAALETSVALAEKTVNDLVAAQKAGEGWQFDPFRLLEYAAVGYATWKGVNITRDGARKKRGEQI